MSNFLKHLKRIRRLGMASFILCVMMAAMNSSALADNIDIVSHSGIWTDFIFNGSAQAAPTTGEFQIDSTGLESAAFCIQLGIAEDSGSAKLTLIDLSANDEYASVAWLMDSYSTGLGYTGYSVDKVIADAAVQLAIWETLYGDDFSNVEYFPGATEGGTIGAGDGLWEETAWELALVYLSNLETAISDGGGLSQSDFSGDYEFYVASFDGSQDLLVAKAVPEPTTMILLGFGLLGVSAVGRRKKG